MKRSPFKPKPTWKRLQRKKRLNPMSKKRKVERSSYGLLRVWFLTIHQKCEIRKMCKGAPSHIICHTKGRGKYYLDVKTWKAGCWACERWLTDHAQQAIKEGLAMDRIGHE